MVWLYAVALAELPINKGRNMVFGDIWVLGE
jgi:hypothetical protein